MPCSPAVHTRAVPSSEECRGLGVSLGVKSCSLTLHHSISWIEEHQPDSGPNFAFQHSVIPDAQTLMLSSCDFTIRYSWTSTVSPNLPMCASIDRYLCARSAEANYRTAAKGSNPLDSREARVSPVATRFR